MQPPSLSAVNTHRWSECVCVCVGVCQGSFFVTFGTLCVQPLSWSVLKGHVDGIYAFTQTVRECVPGFLLCHCQGRFVCSLCLGLCCKGMLTAFTHSHRRSESVYQDFFSAIVRDASCAATIIVCGKTHIDGQSVCVCQGCFSATQRTLCAQPLSGLQKETHSHTHTQSERVCVSLFSLPL